MEDKEINIVEDNLEIVIHPSFPKDVENDKKETTTYDGLESF